MKYVKLVESEKKRYAMIDGTVKEVSEEEWAGICKDAFPEEEERGSHLSIFNPDGSINRAEMQRRIEKAKADFEKELQRKKELYEKTGDADVFTPEDIDAMIQENETFRGKNVDFSQVQKYNKLAESAQWLDANYRDVMGTNCPPLTKERSADVCMDIKSLSICYDERVKRTLAGMILLCDGLTISGLDNGKIHINFLVKDIRTK